MRVSASSLRQIPTVECGFQPLPQKMSGVLLEGMARKNKGKYTRYSDDLTFSFSNPYIHRRGILEKIYQILASEGYEI